MTQEETGMKKRLLAALLAAAVMLAGCGSIFLKPQKTIEVVTGAEEGGLAVTLNTVSMFGETDANTVVYHELIELFMKENPSITVKDKSTTADNEWKANVAADFAVGNEPDVLQFFTDAQADPLIRTNKLVSLEEIRAAYPEYAADILPEALKNVTNTDGVMRAVPTTGFLEVMFCNKDLFESYGIELPVDWESFKNAVVEFRAHGVTPVAVSLNSVPHYWIEALILYSAGLESYQSIPKEAPEEWVQGLELFEVLRNMGAFPSATDTMDNDYALEMFRNKEAAMMFEGTWQIGRIRDTNNTVAVAFPGVPGQRAQAGALTSGFTSGFYITRTAWENPIKRDAAVKFVMAHTSREAILKYWEASNKVCKIAIPVESEGELTPLALSVLECEKAAGENWAKPVDSRMDQAAYDVIVKGIVDISTGSAEARDILNRALQIQASKE